MQVPPSLPRKIVLYLLPMVFNIPILVTVTKHIFEPKFLIKNQYLRLKLIYTYQLKT